jgi:hypothetical protein
VHFFFHQFNKNSVGRALLLFSKKKGHGHILGLPTKVHNTATEAS